MTIRNLAIGLLASQAIFFLLVTVMQLFVWVPYPYPEAQFKGTISVALLALILKKDT